MPLSRKKRDDIGNYHPAEKSEVTITGIEGRRPERPVIVTEDFSRDDNSQYRPNFFVIMALSEFTGTIILASRDNTNYHPRFCRDNRKSRPAEQVNSDNIFSL